MGYYKNIKIDILPSENELCVYSDKIYKSLIKRKQPEFIYNYFIKDKNILESLFLIHEFLTSELPKKNEIIKIYCNTNFYKKFPINAFPKGKHIFYYGYFIKGGIKLSTGKYLKSKIILLTYQFTALSKLNISYYKTKLNKT